MKDSLIKRYIFSSGFDRIIFSISLFCLVGNVAFLYLNIQIWHFMLFFLSLIVLYDMSRNKQLFKSCDMDRLQFFFVKFLLLWGVIISMRSLLGHISIREIYLIFVEPSSFAVYLLPVFSFLMVDYCKMSSIYKVGMVFTMISLYFVYINRDVVMISSLDELKFLAGEDDFYQYLNISQIVPKALFALTPFIICWPQSVRVKIIIITMLIIGIVLPLLLGRRTSAMYVVLIFVSYTLLKLKSKPLYLFIFLFICFILYFSYNYYEDKIMDFFPILYGRLSDDTRSWAEDEFYKDFHDVFSILFGRGATGTYRSATLGVRNLIETGYLNILLHGGLLYLIPYVLLLLRSFYLGFFRSNNKFVNSLALYLFCNIVLLYPSGRFNLDLNTIMIWVAVGVCSTRHYRNSLDVELIHQRSYK